MRPLLPTSLPESLSAVTSSALNVDMDTPFTRCPNCRLRSGNGRAGTSVLGRCQDCQHQEHLAEGQLPDDAQTICSSQLCTGGNALGGSMLAGQPRRRACPVAAAVAAAAAAAPGACDSLHAAAHGTHEDIEGGDHILGSLQAVGATERARSSEDRALEALLDGRYGRT